MKLSHAFIVATFAVAAHHAYADEIFSAGDTFAIGKGYINIPETVWNPPSNEVQPSQLPFKVPPGKTLLITDLYLETDPFDHFPFLMVLAGDAGEGVRTLRTIHLRKPEAVFISFSTPIPLEAGVTLHVIMRSSIPAAQSVNWSVTGRLVDAVAIVKNEPAGEPEHAEYPYPPITRPEKVSLVVQSAQEIQSDFVADPDTLRLARVIRDIGSITFDRQMPDRVYPVWIADAGTKGSVIIDQEMPSCSDFNTVTLLGSFVGSFNVTSCTPGIVKIDTVADLHPGQKIQYSLSDLQPPRTDAEVSPGAGGTAREKTSPNPVGVDDASPHSGEPGHRGSSR